MIVCLCSGVSERGVRALVVAGATTVSDVARACGAGADCGACARALATLIADARACESAAAEVGG